MAIEKDSFENGRQGLLGKTIEVLELLASEPNGIGVREAARRTGVDKSAISRILNQLEKAGYAEQWNSQSSYHPGPKLFSLAASLVEHDNLWKAAQPFLEKIVDLYNETCYLAVKVSDGLVFRGKVDCSHRIRYVIELGQTFPFTTGAAGTAILAGLPESESDEILHKGFERYTELSFADAQEYRTQLQKDRRQGYSFSPGRWVKNGSGIASPYFNAAGQCLGSITLSCPSDRLVGLPVSDAGEQVRLAAEGLSRRLGFLASWEGWLS